MGNALPLSLSPAGVRLARLRAQRLEPRLEPQARAADVARALGGLQAQDAMAAALAVRARAAGPTIQDVEQAQARERSIVRTWTLRGTLHLVAVEDLAWLLPLVGPVFIAASRRRRQELGLDDATCEAGVRLLRQALASQGPLTRAELAERLGPAGIPVDGQALVHLIRYAALSGIICEGPPRDGEPSYVLLDDWAPPGPGLPDDAALAELARRYLEAYGPAGLEDLAAWSGLPVSRLRAAWDRLAPSLIEVDAAGRQAWALTARSDWLAEPPPAAPVVHLLPAFDTYLLGYRERGLAVAPAHARHVHPGGGMLRPTVLVNGRAVGTWQRNRRGAILEVVVEPFEPLTPEIETGLQAEASDLARFLGTSARLRVAAGRRSA